MENTILCANCNQDVSNDTALFCAECWNKNVTIEEGERQTTLLALAELSLRRPGWLDHLERIADKFSGRKMFNGFRETSADIISRDSRHEHGN